MAELLFGITFLFWFSQYAYTPFLNPQLQLMGATATFMGMVSGGYGFTQMIIRLPLGVVSNRLHRQKMFVVGGCLVSAVSAFGMYFWYSPVGFLVFRCISGIAAATWVSFTVLYSSYFPEEESGQAIAMLNVANQSGRLTCFILMAALVSRLGERSSFLISGFAAIFATGAGALISESRTEENSIQLRELPEILKNRNLLICTLLAILTQLAAFSTYNAFAINHASAIGATGTELSIMNIVLVISMAVSNYLVAKFWLKKAGTRRILCLGFGMTFVYCMLFPAVSQMGWVYVLQVLAGVSNSMTFSVLLGACVSQICREYRASAMGFFQAAYGLGMTAGPILMGMAADRFGLSLSYRLTGIFAVAAFLIAQKCLPVEN